MSERDEEFLRHILEAIAKIELYISVGRVGFMSEIHWQDAVVRQLEVIGEATKNLSYELRSASPQVPWRRMAGMRDVLIHDFMEVDMEIVWAVAVSRIPELKRSIRSILDDHQ
jgi:uncharacterized protein with HEPN domain